MSEEILAGRNSVTEALRRTESKAAVSVRLLAWRRLRA